MPIRTYECQDCKNNFEKLVIAAGAKNVECPACESNKTVQTLAMPAKPLTSTVSTNCAGNGPPCARMGCGRKK